MTVLSANACGAIRGTGEFRGLHPLSKHFPGLPAPVDQGRVVARLAPDMADARGQSRRVSQRKVHIFPACQAGAGRVASGLYGDAGVL